MTSIASVTVARYRSFRDPTVADLARLTLLYGENNVGKSALARVPKLLSESRRAGRPGLDSNAAVLRGGGYRDLCWRGLLPSSEDPDLQLGIGLGDGSSWLWTFRWQDAISQSVLHSLAVQSSTITCRLDYDSPRHIRDANPRPYAGPHGKNDILFDGIIPRAGQIQQMDEPALRLSTALDSLTWLSAHRGAGQRGGLSRGTHGNLNGSGDGASALLLSDPDLLESTGRWFDQNLACRPVAESLGSDLERLVLRPSREAGADVPFAELGEGIQHVFPLVVALEQLRRRGGLLIVEEPEAHLHPRLQRALALLVVEVLRAQPAARVLFETHSEVFLLGALSAAVGPEPIPLSLNWLSMAPGGISRIEKIEVDGSGRPSTARLELAFETMGVMRRELIELRRSNAR